MNAKIVKTKKQLLDAFCALAQTRPVEEITVSQLCRAANVNRTTFYKYYSLPSDVVVEAVRAIAAESANIKIEAEEPLYDAMLRMTSAFYENKNLMLLYFRANGNLLPLFYQAIGQLTDNLAFMAKSRNYFLAGGVGGIAAYWMQRNFKDSPKEIASLLTEYIEKVIQ